MTQKNNAEWLALTACCEPQPNPEIITKLFSLVDWSALLALAEEHGVTLLLARAMERWPFGEDPSKKPAADSPTAEGHEQTAAANARAFLAERQREQGFFSLRMSAELFRLTELFAAQDIGLLLVKGPGLAMQAYGDVTARKYGDLDFLVRHGDIARATQLMMDAGYAPQVPLRAIAAGKIPGQYLFRQPEAKMLVELHNDKTMRYYPRGLPIEELFSRSVRLPMDGRDIVVPCVEDHLVLICIHGAKHFWERLLWIADVAALITRQKELRWELATRAAQEAGAEAMLHAGLVLASRVLQARLPEAVVARAEADAAAGGMVKQVMGWLPEAGEARPEFRRGLGQRAIFRMRMRGGTGTGLGYLLRLLFSPTEEDWDAEGGGALGIADIVKRPFRLARKHGSGEKE